MSEVLKLGDKNYSSRLILGTGKYPDFQTMKKAHEISGTQLVTVAFLDFGFQACPVDLYPTGLARVRYNLNR